MKWITIVAREPEGTKPEIVGNLDAHPGDERPISDTCPKSSRDAHSVELANGTVGSGTVRTGIPKRGKWRVLVADG